MKIINIYGGLGNQMFQYALAFALYQKFPNELIKYTKKDFIGYHVRDFELTNIFELKIKEANWFELMKVTNPVSLETEIGRIINKLFPRKYTSIKERKLFHFQEDVFVNGNYYYYGYWQNENYFKFCREKLKDEFKFRNSLDGNNRKIINDMHVRKSVSIHVRRGDYLKYNIYQHICTPKYYKQAINRIFQLFDNPKFYIFSNDHQWCNQNILPMLRGAENVLVDWNTGADSYKDMQLMSNCKVNIIANSSFSWWAAWLNNNEGRLVISPKKWLNDNKVKEQPQADDWILI